MRTTYINITNNKPLFSVNSLSNYLQSKKQEIQNEILSIKQIPQNPEELINELLAQHIINPIELTEITQGESIESGDLIIISFFINFKGDSFLLTLNPSHSLLSHHLPNLNYSISDLWVKIEYKIDSGNI